MPPKVRMDTTSGASIPSVVVGAGPMLLTRTSRKAVFERTRLRPSVVSLAVFACVIQLIGCATTYRRARPDLPSGEREPAELTALYEDFDSAIEQRRFDEADAMLEELEDGLKNAARATVMHRSYPGLSARVEKAPKRLKKARRGAAIDNAVEQVEAGIANLRELSEGFARDSVSQEDLERFVDSMDALDEAIDEHREFRSDSRYRDLDAEGRTAILTAQADLPKFRWQREASERLTDGFSELQTSTPRDPTQALSLAQQAEARVALAEQCLQETRSLSSEDGFDDSTPVASAIGVASLADVERQCQERSIEERGVASYLRWHHGVETFYAELGERLEALEQGGNAIEKLAANERATEGLRQCAERFDPDLAGADAKVRFRGYLGPKGVNDLMSGCEKVLVRLDQKRPQLHWRADLLRAQQSRDEALALTENNQGEPDARRDAFCIAMRLLQVCHESASALATFSEARWRGARIPRSERRAAVRLEKQCRLKRRSFADKIEELASSPR